MLGRKYADRGFILENIVYLELLRRGYKVFIGKSGEYEIDFIAQNENGTEYYQVDESPMDHNGIKQIYALDWLLKK